MRGTAFEPGLNPETGLFKLFSNCYNVPMENIWNLWKVVLRFPGLNVPNGNKCTMSLELIIDFRSQFFQEALKSIEWIKIQHRQKNKKIQIREISPGKLVCNAFYTLS